VIAVPRRGLADLQWILVDRRVDIGRTGADARGEDGHVEEGRAHVDDDLTVRGPDELCRLLHIEGVERMGDELAGRLQALLLVDGLDDRLALGESPRSDMDIAEDIVVLRAFVGHHLAHATGTDDQNVPFHLGLDLLSFRMSLRTGSTCSLRRKTRARGAGCRRAHARRWTASGRR